MSISPSLIPSREFVNLRPNDKNFLCGAETVNLFLTQTKQEKRAGARAPARRVMNYNVLPQIKKLHLKSEEHNEGAN